MSGRLLVTGGAGYLASELLRRARGWELAATWHSREPAEPGRADWIQLDVRDGDAVGSVVDRVRPDAIVHTAYLQKGEGAYETTVHGAQAVAETAQRVGARLVHMSTDVLFDGRKGSAYTERDEPTPINDYGRAKADAERLVAAACPGAVMVRTSLVYDGSGTSRHEEIALQAARGELDMPFFTDELRCPVLVGDLASALLELMRLDVAGVLHVAGADAVSRYEFACLVASANGVDPSGIAAASIQQQGIERPLNCALDSSRAASLLRTRLRGAREALALEQARSRA